MGTNKHAASSAPDELMSTRLLLPTACPFVLSPHGSELALRAPEMNRTYSLATEASRARTEDPGPKAPEIAIDVPRLIPRQGLRMAALRVTLGAGRSALGDRPSDEHVITSEPKKGPVAVAENRCITRTSRC